MSVLWEQAYMGTYLISKPGFVWLSTLSERSMAKSGHAQDIPG